MKKRKKMRASLVILILLTLILAVIFIEKLKGRYEEKMFSDAYVSIYEVKQELLFTVYSQEEWDEWFSKEKKTYLTYEAAQKLLEKLGVLKEISLKEKSRKAISRADWNEIYEQILDYLDMEQNVQKNSFLVLDKIAAKEQTVLVTNQGDFFTHLPDTYFETWMAYDVYVIENDCVGTIQISTQEQTIKNAYLKSCENGILHFLYAGGVYEKQVQEKELECASSVCDFVVAEGKLTAIKTKQDKIQGQLLSYNDSSIEISDYGKVHHSGKLPVYQIYGEAEEKSISDVVLGNMDVAYVTAGNEICAILILQPAQIQNIRVLLLAEDGTNFRRDVYLKCETETEIVCGDIALAIQAQTLLHPAELLSQDTEKTYIVKPKEKDSMIYLCDENGIAISNGYAGTIEVRSVKQGYTVVNELPLEEYLYAVVPSEMPSKFQPEALKAQAVCARSYAYMQLIRADLAAYGAHINDSTAYQVYNKVERTPQAIAAVDATCGNVITWQGNVVEAYYFSTSMGYTDTAEIWNVKDSSAFGYLKKTCLNQTDIKADFTDEKTFSEYIKQTAEGYDSDIRYYRWFATADIKEKTAQINEILEQRHSVSEKNVIYYEADDLKQMGNLMEISVEERSSSGSILTLVLSYEYGIVKVKTEYNIRKVLGCCTTKIVYADSKESNDITMLPSAFAAVEKQEDGTYLLSGGGYGHGLGMSQNGANGMAHAGMDYLEILNFFYQDIVIKTMDEMEGNNAE